MVGLFVILGFVAIGWMLIKFRDMPAKFNRYGAYEISAYFPSVSGIEINGPVYFRGYPVGRVIQISPPTLVEHPDKNDSLEYMTSITIAIDDEFMIPQNTTPTIYSKGLGTSYLEFVWDNNQPSKNFLLSGDTLYGRISTGSDFLPEKTQAKIETMISSLTKLSITLNEQLTTDGNINIAQIIQRMGITLDQMNNIIGNSGNQKNIQQGLQNFNNAFAELENAIKEVRKFTDKANKLVDTTKSTMASIEKVAGKSYNTFEKTAENIQVAADQLAISLKSMNLILAKINKNEGTAGRLINDPRLYESMTDASKNLELTLKDIQTLLKGLNEKGIIGYKGNK